MSTTLYLTKHPVAQLKIHVKHHTTKIKNKGGDFIHKDYGATQKVVMSEETEVFMSNLPYRDLIVRLQGMRADKIICHRVPSKDLMFEMQLVTNFNGEVHLK